jgi:hypothetical protein
MLEQGAPPPDRDTERAGGDFRVRRNSEQSVRAGERLGSARQPLLDATTEPRQKNQKNELALHSDNIGRHSGRGKQSPRLFSRMPHPPSRWLLLVLLSAASCGPRSEAQPESVAADTTTPWQVGPTADSTARRPDGETANHRSPDRAAVSPPGQALDSVHYLVSASRIPSRTQRDSISLAAAIRKGLRHPGWPVPGPEPGPGAILPARRIVAFYGNPLSTRMGILGEIAPEPMLARLDSISAQWHAADPATPVQPALHLIAVVAQDRPGRDGMYRLRMDSTLIEKVYGWARSRNAILFLDIQAGLSTIEKELPRLLPWLARPDVHLAIDPEFYMHYHSAGHPPGKRIGSVTSTEVNYAVETLARLVSERQLPPKVLVIHRFTIKMLQDVRQIRLDPRVQVVNNMDGWGQPWLKFDSYALCQVGEPIQFTGFKLFFHNDTRKGDLLLTPKEVLGLRPRPVYIQYQ